MTLDQLFFPHIGWVQGAIELCSTFYYAKTEHTFHVQYATKDEMNTRKVNQAKA